MKVAFYDTKPYDHLYFKDDSKLEFMFFDCRLTEQTASLAESADAVCAFVNDHLDRPCLTALNSLGIHHVALRCAGFNNVDLDAAKELGFTVSRVPSYSPHAVAEHTLALLLSLNRHIHRAFNRVREHNFSLSGLIGFDLHGKTAGVIGAGKIGRIVAEILKSFGCRVLVHDPHIDQGWADSARVEVNSFNDLLEQSDIVSLHLPLTSDTYHLINAEALATMRQGSYILNTGRGKLIETKALLDSLKSGHIGGVALDVYEEEEGVFFEDLSGEILQDDDLRRLLTFPNVLITAHQGFLTHEALKEIAFTTSDNLKRCELGTELIENTELT